MLSHRRLRWLDHVNRMQDGHIPKDIMFGQLATCTRPLDRPLLRYKDVCKRDMELTGIEPKIWEYIANDRVIWRHTVKEGITKGEAKRRLQIEDKRQKRKTRMKKQVQDPASKYICNIFGLDCHAKIGLISHYRACERR